MFVLCWIQLHFRRSRYSTVRYFPNIIKSFEVYFWSFSFFILLVFWLKKKIEWIVRTQFEVPSTNEYTWNTKDNRTYDLINIKMLKFNRNFVDLSFSLWSLHHHLTWAFQMTLKMCSGPWKYFFCVQTSIFTGEILFFST